MQKFVFLMLVSLLFISFTSSPYCATLIVKQDGSGDASTIQAAFNAAGGWRYNRDRRRWNIQ